MEIPLRPKYGNVHIFFFTEASTNEKNGQIVCLKINGNVDFQKRPNGKNYFSQVAGQVPLLLQFSFKIGQHNLISSGSEGKEEGGGSGFYLTLSHCLVNDTRSAISYQEVADGDDDVTVSFVMNA